ncbi:MAG TPA: glutamate--tRNA ligase [Solirubrobacteraceae bacterium]|jgi:glutamyl-tRNA synthetase|nr:glutamate--tRNA ligase [Solirubrobacteraceae bacterium]
MRVRFAPSPTGALHIGGARTALYNWLLAQQAPDNRLVLRIEDTDRERSTPENVEQILDALRWLELGWDEGPIFQSERADRHQEVLAQLLDAGHAYRSTATADDVKAYKQEHGSERGFRGTAEDTGAVRLRVPDEGATVVHDVIRGDTTFEHVHLDDPVIARADGSVLYNFAVAVDDLDAGITHVVRGEDHLSNTPKQLLVFEALGVDPPAYAHLPLLLGPDGKKLSKRHGAASVQELRAAGYLPEAVRNYIALLGWGYDDESTLLTTEQMVEGFSLERVSRNPAVFDEQKLRWMNGRYLRALSLDELVRRLEEFTGRTGIEGAVAIAQDKMQTLADFEPLAAFIFDGPADDPDAFAKVIANDGGVDNLAAARRALAAAEPFDEPHVEAALRAVVEERGVKPREVFQPLRVALAGRPVSPGIFETVALLGRDETLRRVDRALARA